MIKSEAVDIIVRRIGTSPIMRRNANNLILTFTQSEALELIHEITRAFDGDADKVWMHIEFEGGMFYPQEVTSDA